MGLAALLPTSNFKKERGRDFRGGYTLILGQAHTEQDPNCLACMVLFTINCSNWEERVVLELTMQEHLIMQTQKLKKPLGTHTEFSHLPD